MARIRTIKPEFFTSEDIVSLPSDLARLFYIALWCEADREGRLKWKPMTFQLRYFPKRTDEEIAAVGAELLERGHVVLYGDGLAWLPKFLHHQHINPREAKSNLPQPPVDSVDNSRVSDASARVSDTQVGREGKEGKGREGALSRVEPLGDKSPKFKDAPQANGGWWKSDAGIDAKGKELGVEPQRGETYAAYKDRLFSVLASRKQASG